MPNIYNELHWRGLIFDHTDGLADLLGSQAVTVYNGFDPTANSLHIGHLVPMVTLARLQRFGHHPIALAGGGTGMIGDPSGRSSERNLLSLDEIAHNVECVKQQLAAILDFEVKRNPARIVNNNDWLSRLSMIEYLRDVGKHFTVNYMLGKDSVRNRLEREDGLSYTEFSYMLLQAYDYLHLHDHFGCNLQMGGSDQWGNITAGTTLIRKLRGATAHALVLPLITRADGTKFGKTADGDSVWLDPQRTSPFRFYQFFYNSEDERVIDLLRFYTFLTQAEIDELAHKVATEPHLRAAQQRLAQEVTRMVHGESGLAQAEKATAALFGGALEGLSAVEIADIFSEVASSSVARSALANGGLNIVDLLADSTLASSKGDARRQIQNGAFNINDERIADIGRAVTLADSIDGQFIVLRRGRRTFHLVRIAD